MPGPAAAAPTREATELAAERGVGPEEADRQQAAGPAASLPTRLPRKLCGGGQARIDFMQKGWQPVGPCFSTDDAALESMPDHGGNSGRWKRAPTGRGTSSARKFICNAHRACEVHALLREESVGWQWHISRGVAHTSTCTHGPRSNSALSWEQVAALASHLRLVHGARLFLSVTGAYSLNSRPPQ